MPDLETANRLFENGRAHAIAADRLFGYSRSEAEARGLDDPSLFAFNGTYSLSVHYLLCLGFELMLKSAYVFHDGDGSRHNLKSAIGHDLVGALDAAEHLGFRSEAPHLRNILEHLREPFLDQSFRYERPDQMVIPETKQIIDALEVLDQELRIKLNWKEQPQ